VDVAIALSVVPVIVGLVALALWFGLPAPYETPAAIVAGVVISLGYALAAQSPRRVARRRTRSWRPP
jgi:MFS superfamily sulfate permease-like transporter